MNTTQASETVNFQVKRYKYAIEDPGSPDNSDSLNDITSDGLNKWRISRKPKSHEVGIMLPSSPTIQPASQWVYYWCSSTARFENVCTETKGKGCNNCSKEKHFCQVCQPKSTGGAGIAQCIVAKDSDSNNEFILAPKSSISTSPQLRYSVNLSKIPCTFIVDKGSSITIANRNTYNKVTSTLNSNHTLKMSMLSIH